MWSGSPTHPAAGTAALQGNAIPVLLWGSRPGCRVGGSFSQGKQQHTNSIRLGVSAGFVSCGFGYETIPGMKPQATLGRATTPDGKELVLYERDGVYSIRVNGLELMSSRAHGSEEALARLVLARVRRPHPRVLVGGLGMGYTLRAVLDVVPQQSKIVVAEIFPAVVEWNQADLAGLANAPLSDPRVTVRVTDVADLLDGHPIFDAILLDVDNGPDAFTIARNTRLYGAQGLEKIRRSLRRPGVLGVWSADPDPPFERRLSKAGFRVQVETVPAHRAVKGPKHTIFIATVA